MAEDFDTIPDRKNRKRNKNVKTEETIVNESTTSRNNIMEAFDSDCEMDSIMADIEVSVDDFDDVPSRKSRKKGQGKEETTSNREARVSENEDGAQKPTVKVETTTKNTATGSMVYNRQNEVDQHKKKDEAKVLKSSNAKQTVKKEAESNNRPAVVYSRSPVKQEARYLYFYIN